MPNLDASGTHHFIASSFDITDRMVQAQLATMQQQYE